MNLSFMSNRKLWNTNKFVHFYLGITKLFSVSFVVVFLNIVAMLLQTEILVVVSTLMFIGLGASVAAEEDELLEELAEVS